MIGYLKGKVIYMGADSAIIETGGVGYEVVCSASAFSKMSAGATAEVYTYLQVSETAGVVLYGFSGIEEKNMFLKLVSVSGVGPKMGISVLSSMDLNGLAAAIATQDIKRLSSVKGLGKKTAERIILELREKVGVLPENSASSRDISAPISQSDGDEDAVVALMTLGFTRAESQKAVQRARDNGAKSVEEIIMVALKSMN
ncbi:MAG: Holliday junction branch migration protein RuvA [Candidatus Coproplasma sp.]